MVVTRVDGVFMAERFDQIVGQCALITFVRVPVRGIIVSHLKVLRRLDFQAGEGGVKAFPIAATGDQAGDAGRFGDDNGESSVF